MIYEAGFFYGENTMSTALSTISNKLSMRFGMGSNTTEVIEVLKSTAFKGSSQVTDAQMTALMIVSDQYGLNPWTKEIYAFPDKGGIVPVVGVDGWSRIINDHPQFDGLEFEQDEESCTCIMYRKDRGHAIKVTEWLNECKKTGSGPWSSHPKRMLRHKALIQCARLAFGFVGIYDQDEAERIVDNQEKEINPLPTNRETATPKFCTDDDFLKMTSDSVGESGEILRMRWKSGVKSGKSTADDAIKTIGAKVVLTDSQIETIKSWEEKDPIEGELL